jgi:hypothetical protein
MPPYASREGVHPAKLTLTASISTCTNAEWTGNVKSVLLNSTASSLTPLNTNRIRFFATFGSHRRCALAAPIPLSYAARPTVTAEMSKMPQNVILYWALVGLARVTRRVKRSDWIIAFEGNAYRLLIIQNFPTAINTITSGTARDVALASPCTKENASKIAHQIKHAPILSAWHDVTP